MLAARSDCQSAVTYFKLKQGMCEIMTSQIPWPTNNFRASKHLQWLKLTQRHPSLAGACLTDCHKNKELGIFRHFGCVTLLGLDDAPAGCLHDCRIEDETVQSVKPR